MRKHLLHYLDDSVDCYKSISGETIIVATILKDVLGFCLSYWVFNVHVKDGGTPVHMI